VSKFEVDIENWIENRFSNREKALGIIEPILELDSKISASRVIRCVLFLSGSDCEKLASYTEKAIGDCRDVIWWAEYDNRTAKVRDFDKALTEQTDMTVY
jgi:hypothetical protein